MKRTLPLRLAVTFLLAAIPAARAHAQGGGDVARVQVPRHRERLQRLPHAVEARSERTEQDLSRMLSATPSSSRCRPSPRCPTAPGRSSHPRRSPPGRGRGGVSFAANLTPDAETGLGKWTEKDFADTMRSGRHLGRGRAILPPMPTQNIAVMTDADLRAVSPSPLSSGRSRTASPSLARRSWPPRVGPVADALTQCF